MKVFLDWMIELDYIEPTTGITIKLACYVDSFTFMTSELFSF
jgi:hypothetical protein